MLDDLVAEQEPFPVSFAGNVLPPEEPAFVDEPDDSLVLKLTHSLFPEGSLPP